MKRISSIEFLNYKAFYGTGENNKLKIPNGNNVLIYGENGSGKSSIYEGVKQFLESSIDTREVVPARNLRVPEFYEINKENEDGIPVQERIHNEIGLKIIFDTFNNEHELVSTDEIIFTNKEITTTEHNFLRQTLSLNSFLSYRELLKTYLVDNPKDKETFQAQFGKLIIETIIAERINSVTQTKNIDEWNRLFTPKIWYKEHFAEQLRLGVLKDIENINIYLGELVHYFDKELNVKLVLNHLYVDFLANERENRVGKYPYISADVAIEIQDLNIEDDIENENHLTVLNEARLSSLAISIYLAAILSTPQENFDFKILFLDDIFIGLDMSNRLPLLEILCNYKKPKFIPEVDGEGNIVTTVEIIDGVISREERCFFSDYQIFITTYDRNWYEVAKRQLNTYSFENWKYLEIYSNINELGFNVPFILEGKTYREKADFYYKKNDFITCANYLRKSLEEKLKILLPKHLLFKEEKDENGNFTDIKPLKNLEQYIVAFINFCKEFSVPVGIFKDLKNYKDWYFNPFSHDNIESPLYRSELLKAMAILDKVLSIEITILENAGIEKYFELIEGNEYRKFIVILNQNLRKIEIEGTTYFTHPNVECNKWLKNEEEKEVSWSDHNLFSFYRNKFEAFYKTIGEARSCELTDTEIISFYK